MEKSEYIRTQLEVFEFQNADVIATSAPPAPTPDAYEGGGY